MKFKLTRSSYRIGSEKHLHELEELGFEVKIDRSHMMGCKFEEWMGKYGITKDKDDLAWEHPITEQESRKEIEINTLEELMAFIKKHGEVIIDEDSIEIYDGYREG